MRFLRVTRNDSGSTDASIQGQFDVQIAGSVGHVLLQVPGHAPTETARESASHSVGSGTQYFFIKRQNSRLSDAANTKLKLIVSAPEMTSARRLDSNFTVDFLGGPECERSDGAGYLGPVQNLTAVQVEKNGIYEIGGELGKRLNRRQNQNFDSHIASMACLGRPSTVETLLRFNDGRRYSSVIRAIKDLLGEQDWNQGRPASQFLDTAVTAVTLLELTKEYFNEANRFCDADTRVLFRADGRQSHVPTRLYERAVNDYAVYSYALSAIDIDGVTLPRALRELETSGRTYAQVLQGPLSSPESQNAFFAAFGQFGATNYLVVESIRDDVVRLISNRTPRLNREAFNDLLRALNLLDEKGKRLQAALDSVRARFDGAAALLAGSRSSQPEQRALASGARSLRARNERLANEIIDARGVMVALENFRTQRAEAAARFRAALEWFEIPQIGSGSLAGARQSQFAQDSTIVVSEVAARAVEAFLQRSPSLFGDVDDISMFQSSAATLQACMDVAPSSGSGHPR